MFSISFTVMLSGTRELVRIKSLGIGLPGDLFIRFGNPIDVAGGSRSTE